MDRKDFTSRNKPRLTMDPSGPGGPGGPDNAGFRRRRRAAARQEKRGRQARIILMVAIIVAAVAFVAVYFMVRSGSGDQAASVAPPPISDDAGAANVIMMVKDGSGRLSHVLVLAEAGEGGYGLMVLPGRAVVQTPAAGFQRLDKLLELETPTGIPAGSSAQLQMDQAVSGLLEIPIRYHVAISAEALSNLIEQTGAINLQTGRPLTLNQAGGAGALTLAAGDNNATPSQVAALLKVAQGDTRDGPEAIAVFYQGLQAALATKPEMDRKRIATDLVTKAQTDMNGGDLTDLIMAVTSPGSVFAVTSLPVRATGSGDAWYFEPELGELAALTGSSGQSAGIQLEIRNGTEQTGMVEAAGLRLDPLGFDTILTPETSGVNYDITQIRCGSDAISAGYQVRGALNAGDVIKDDSMEKKQIIVIMGRDMSKALTGQQ